MDKTTPNLIFIDEFNLLGTNYYWRNREKWEISKEELISAGLPDERIRVDQKIIEPLMRVDQELRPQGYRLYISEGYRPKELYELVYKKRIAKFGKDQTDRLINMESMPHAEGNTVDAYLWNTRTKKEEILRDQQEGIDAMFIDFYKDKNDAASKGYQHLQEILINTMLQNGFRIGPRREYFHFYYDPTSPPSY